MDAAMQRVQLSGDETRLVYLAMTYHLASPRPAAEIAAMRPLWQALDEHLPAAAPPEEEAAAERGVALQLAPLQLVRLGDAIYAVVNELKQFEMAHGRSAAPGFSDAVARTFPHVHPDHGGLPGAALDLTGEAMALRRRLDPAIREAREALERERVEAAAAQRAASNRWWKVWRRD